MLKVLNLFKEYKSGKGNLCVIKNASIKMNESEITSVVGPSGSGKTTLLKCLGGIEKPTSGEILFNNKEVFTNGNKDIQDFRRNHIGFIFQDFRLLPQHNVLENVMLPQLPYTSSPKELSSKASELLSRVGMAERSDHLATQLSGGEKQRVAIARSLLNNPSVILCDEPTGNLDQENSNNILGLLKSLAYEHSKCIVIVTHDKEIAKESNKTITVNDGVFEESGIV